MNRRRIVQFFFVSVAVFFAVALFSLPQNVSAQFDEFDKDPNLVLDDVGEQINIGGGEQDIRVIIVKIIRFALGFLGLLAVIITLYGGFVYMTSAGNQEKVLQARRILINGLIGLVIIMFSYAIVSFIINKLTDIVNGPGSGGSNYACSTPGECNGSGGNFPGGNCYDTVFVAKSITPNQNNAGMNNITVRAVFTKGVAGNPEDVLSVRRGSADLTGQMSFSYVNNANQSYKNRVVEGVYATEDVNCGPDAEGGEHCFPIDGAEYVVEIQDGVTSLNGASLETGTVCGGFDPPSQGRFHVKNNTDDDIDPTVGSITLVAADDTVLGGTAVKVPKGNAYLVRSDIDDNSGVGYVHMTFSSSGGGSVYHWYDGPIESDKTFAFSFDSLVVGSGFSESETYTVTITAFDIDGNSTTQSLDFSVVGAHCGNGIQDEDETGVDVGGSCGGSFGDPCTTSNDCSGDLVCGPGGTCVGYPVIKAVSPLEGAPGNWVTIQGNYFGTTEGGIDFSTSVGGGGQYTNWSPATIAACGVAGSSWDDTYVVAEVPSGFVSGEEANVRITVPAGGTNDLKEYLDGGILFDNANDRVAVTHASDLNPGDDSFTASLWVRHTKDITDSAATTQQNLLIKNQFDPDPGARERYSISIKDDGGRVLYVLQDGDGGSIQFTGDTVIAPNQWHHIVLVIDRDEEVLRTYVNGAPDNQSVWPSISGIGSIDPNTSLFFGSDPNNVDGFLDEITLFEEALSSNVVDTLYDIGQSGTVLEYKNVVDGYSPIAHWPLNELSGDDVAHDTIGNFHGVYQGVSQHEDGVFALNNIFALKGDTVVYTDDIQNDTGLQDLFTFNDVVRPGVCRAVLAENFTVSVDGGADVVYAAGSKKGPAEALLGIDGKGFGTSGNTDVFIGGKKAKKETLQTLFASAFIPKNMNAGVVGVRVEVDGVSSNGVPFTIVTGGLEGSVPEISAISPDKSTSGSYITIQGSGFGDVVGSVYVAKTVGEVKNCGTPAESDGSTCTLLNVTDFPNYCGVTWKNNQVVAEVPSVSEYGNYALILRNASNQPTSGEDVFEIYDGEPLPSICSLDPTSGPAPLAQDSEGLRLRGINFSSEPEVYFWRPGANIDDNNTWLSSLVHLLDGGASVIDSRNDTDVVTFIPYNQADGYSMESGPIQIESDTGELSNSVLYTVSDCRTADAIPGFKCCEEGKDEGLWKPSGYACADEVREAGYVWRFTSGLIPRVPRVGVSCTDVPGGSVDGALSFPSPVPSIEWPDGNNACRNASVAVRIEDASGAVIAMDEVSVLANVKVYTCGNGAQSLCANISDNVDPAGDIDGVELADVDIDVSALPSGLLYIRQTPPMSELVENTWYHVEFGTGVKSADSSSLIGTPIPGQPLKRTRPCRKGTAFCYDFRVGEEACVLRDVGVHPSFHKTKILGLVAQPPGSANPMYYFLWGMGDRACTVLNVDGLGWNWSSESALLAIATSAPDVLNNPPRYTDSRAKVTAENDAPGGVDIEASLDSSDVQISSQVDVLEYADFGKPFENAQDKSPYDSDGDTYWDSEIDKEDYGYVPDPDGDLLPKVNSEILIEVDLGEVPSDSSGFYPKTPDQLEDGETANIMRRLFYYKVLDGGELKDFQVDINESRDSSNVIVNRNISLSHSGKSSSYARALDTAVDAYSIRIVFDANDIVLYINGQQAVAGPWSDAEFSLFGEEGGELQLGGISSHLDFFLYGTLEEFVVTNNFVSPLIGEDVQLQATSTLVIDLGDPKVVYHEPECNEACINAGVRADFNRRMATSTFIDGFHLYQCPDLKDPNCVVDDTDEVSVSEDELYVSSNEFSLQYDPSSHLIKNTRYKVVLTPDIKAIGGYDADGNIKEGGKSIELTEWFFKTKDDGTPCEASLVTVHPNPFTAFLIGEKTSYIATPRSSPNSCSKYGQALDRNDYTYGWSADLQGGKQVVDISQFKGGHTVAPYCSGNCLPTGSDIPRSVDIEQIIMCGNGKVDVGEDCDIAELADDGTLLEVVGESCTLDCRRPGNESIGDTGDGLCGNGLVEWWEGELCDTKDDNTKLFCTNTCELLGAAAATEAGTCGDGIVAYNETCDTGLSVEEAVAGGFPIHYSRIGCNENCLHEGTRPIASYCIDAGTVTGVCEDRVSVCGNGVIESGEECEVGIYGATSGQCGETCLLKDVCDNPLLKQCDEGDDGCNQDCTLRGSSLKHGTPSVCGDGVDGSGEFHDTPTNQYDYQCELDTFDTSGGAGPVQVATAIGEADGDPTTGSQQTLIHASIVDAPFSIETDASYTLQCGYREFDTPSIDADPVTPDVYNSCPNNDDNSNGVANNTCCLPRPVRAVEYPVDGAGFGGALPACPNTNIEATFPGEIDRNTVFDNVMIVRGYVNPESSFNCGSDSLNVTTLVNQTLAYAAQPEMHSGSFWKQWFGGVKNYFTTLFRTDVHAGQQEDMVQEVDLWCRTNVSMTPDVRYVFDNATQESAIIESTVSLNIHDSLVEDAIYGIVLLGGPDGIRDARGVSIKHRDPSTASRDDIWVFKTGDKACRLDDVVVDPDSQLFTAPNTPHNFHAQAVSFAYGSPIEIVPTNQYGWTWKWGPKDNPVFAIPATGDTIDSPSIAIASKNVEGSLTAIARATVTTDTFSGANDIGKSVIGTTQLTSLFCEHPWPEADGSSWSPYEDDVFNFSMHYCADAGQSGVDNRDDDLPYLDDELVIINKVVPSTASIADQPLSTQPVVGGVGVPDFIGPDTIFSGPGGAAAIPGVGSVGTGTTAPETATLVVTDDLLKRSLFFNNKNDDVIGLQIFDNNSGQLTIDNWFKAKFPDASLPQSIQLDGYDVLTDGDNYYVGALNVGNTKVPTAASFHRIFDNVYIFSVNEGAEAGTREVLGDLMDSLLFNTNFTDYGYCLTSSGNLFSSPENYNDAYVCRSDFDCRDASGEELVVSSAEVLSGVCSNAKTKFFRDNERLRHVQEIQNGLADTYPDLQAGSFIPHYSTSRWNQSWRNELKLGVVDPLNEWTACDGEAQTCYDEATRIFKCPEHMSVYEYHYNTGDGTYDLHMQMEYFTQENLVEQYFSPLIPNKDAFVMDRFCDPVQSYSPLVNACGDGVVGAGEVCDPPGSSKLVDVGALVAQAGSCQYSSGTSCASGEADCGFQRPDGSGQEVFVAKNTGSCGLIDDSGNWYEFVDLSTSDLSSTPNIMRGFSCGGGSGTLNCSNIDTYTGKSVRMRKIDDFSDSTDYTEDEFGEFWAQNFSNVGCLINNLPLSVSGWEPQQCVGAAEGLDNSACSLDQHATQICGNDCKSVEYGLCTQQFVCGNGITEPGEKCDSGDFNNQYGYCSDNCQSFAGYCGDGVKQDEEFCDWSTSGSSLYDSDPAKSCSYDCKSVGGFCGDDIPQTEDGEQCDDGNDENLDGCSNQCRYIGIECREAIPSWDVDKGGSFPNWKVSGGNTTISIFFVTDAEWEPFKTFFDQYDLADEFPSHVPECVGLTGAELCAEFELACNQVDVLVPLNQPAVQCDQILSRDLNAWVEVKCDGVYTPPTEVSNILLEDPVCGNGVKEGESTHPDAAQDAWEECDLGEEKNGDVCTPGYGPDGGCTYCSNSCKSIYVESSAQCGNGVIDYVGINEDSSLYETCENTEDGLVVNNPIDPVSCGTGPEHKGTILCNNTCDEFINTCKTCTVFNDGSRTIPRVAYLNPMIGDGEDWNLGDEVTASLYRVNKVPSPIEGGDGESGTYESGDIDYLGSSKLAFYREDGPPQNLVYKDPMDYANLLDDAEYFHNDSNTIETDAVCDGSYTLLFSVSESESITQLNEDQGDSFDFPVNGEGTVVQHEYVYSPAVPEDTYRVVVRWDDSVADEKTFYGGIYSEDMAGPTGAGGPVNGPILRYTDAETVVCTNMVLNAQEYWRPAGSGCGDYEDIAFVHPQIGESNNTNIQSFTIDLSGAGKNESVGFFVSALNSRIGDDTYKWKDIYVDVYAHHPNDAPTYSVYQPVETFHIVEAAGTSGNQSARFWHVFNFVKEDDGTGVEKYHLRSVPKGGGQVYSDGRITTDECSLKQGIPGAIGCNP